jgi:hypothetical protein
MIRNQAVISLPTLVPDSDTNSLKETLMILRELCVCLIFVFVAGNTFAVEPQTGPVIKDLGPVFEVPEGS